MENASKKAKYVGRFSLLAGLALALALFSPLAHAVNYTPSTTVMIYVHGFDMDGYNSTGIFGDDSLEGGILDGVSQIAAFTGRPTWQQNFTAPNQVGGATYYGTIPPAWYTSADIAADNAAASGVPRYALRIARYAKYVMDRSGATGINLITGSFGTEVTRYLIEHNLLNLASDQKICRWEPVVGVLRGNWAAGAIPGWLADLFGADSPDIDQMTYSWVNSNISANSTMNTSYYAPIIITQFVATNDGDAYITALNNNSNDGTNMTSDEFFAGYSTTAALHAATDGTLQMPGLAYYPTEHTGIVDHTGMWAGVVSASENNVRVTIKLSRFKALKTNDNWLTGNGEWVYRAQTYSPRAATLYGVTEPMCDINWENGASPMWRLAKNQTIYPNSVLFDMIVPAGETAVNLNFTPWELDNKYPFYSIVEISGNSNMGTQVRSISTTGNSVVTVIQSGNYEADFTTTIKSVY